MVRGIREAPVDATDDAGRVTAGRLASAHSQRSAPKQHDHTMQTRTLLRLLRGAILFIVLLAAVPILTLAFGRVPAAGDWRTASHRSTGLAPDPAIHHDAVVQVYAGRAFGWRGAFAVHTWLSAKPVDADRYTRYEVIGWYARSGRSVVSETDLRAPDAEWYGATPRLLRDLRGADAEAVIARLAPAVASYPHADTYRAWPGPNSNTFLAHLGREIPELRLTLPSTAIGKDYLPAGQVFARSPSGTGYQASIAGLLGVIAGGDEGFELNVLGLVTGIDLVHPALKVPGIGRVPAND
jgi:hypothetical protein